MSAEPSPMLFEKNVAIPAGDGVVLRGNLFRPAAPGRYPVIMCMGVYGKDVHFADAYAPQWANLLRIYPGLCADGSSGRYLRWEIVDPERWVPHGYVVLAVDSRGSGQSPGYLEPRSPREAQDYYDAIEWAGTQDWSNGKVGLIGVSYLASNQWQAAALRPPHLAAIVPWEGWSDYYRDGTRHGGIFSNAFMQGWWPRQVLSNQHGNAATPHRDRETGAPTTGEAIRPELLAGNRIELIDEHLRHPLCDAWHASRTPDLSRIEVPVLSAGNWGGPGVHLRGNIEGFTRVSSKQKWLSMHIGTHYESFYLPEYVAVQRKFFDCFLKGIDSGWMEQPRVSLAVRTIDGTVKLTAQAWPLPQTEWRQYHLDAGAMALDARAPLAPGTCAFPAATGEAVFETAPFAAETMFAGPVCARLRIASSTTDADLFLSLHLVDPHGAEVRFVGAHEPTPLARGWLRASHRKTDPRLSLPYRPWHTHDEVQKLTPGTIYDVDVEIWPTSIVVPAGYRLRLIVAGRDLEYADVAGRVLHNHPDDRGTEEFGGTTTIHTGGTAGSWLQMPVISSK